MRTAIIGLALVPLAALLTSPASAEPALAMVFTDRTGAPATWAEATLVDLDTGAVEQVESTTGTATVPVRRYAAFTRIHTGDEASLLVWPDLGTATTATFDARRARPVDVRVPERGAVVAAAIVSAELTFDVAGERRVVGEAVTSADAPRLSSAHLGPAHEGLVGSVKVDMTAREIRTSPYHYALYWEQDGRMFTGLREHLTDRRDLTENRADYGLLGTSTDANVATFARNGRALSVPVTLPSTRTEYYQKGTEWEVMLCHGPAGAQDPLSCLSGRPGPSWNHGPFLPTTQLIERLENRLRIFPGLADQAGHLGLARSDLDGTLTLSRDGQVVATAPLDRPGFTDLPPAPARYRLEVTGTVATLLPGSTFRAAWTFVSGYAPIGEGRLPAHSVRLTPRLDPTNHAWAGRPLTVPVRVSTGVREATVAASFDAGGTWRQLTVRPTESGWVTTVTPPVGAGDISFRTTAADAEGNTVEQELTRAVRLRQPTDQP